MQNAYDLIVVGAGALGAFHAYFALQQGLKVLLLEKDARPREATVRNFGQIITSRMAEGAWFDYARAGLATYQQIQAEYDISIRQNGSLYLGARRAPAALPSTTWCSQGYNSCPLPFLHYVQQSAGAFLYHPALHLKIYHH